MTDRLRQSFDRLRSFFRRAEHDCDLDAEVSDHLQIVIEENLERPLAPAEARRQAPVRLADRNLRLGALRASTRLWLCGMSDLHPGNQP